MRKVFGIVVVGAALVAGYLFLSRPDTSDERSGQTATGAALVEITVPDTLSASAGNGKTIYDTNCAVCHAPNGVGQDGVAPPLVHKIYEPGHHGDESFQRAVALGVPAHHWRFGDMPPVEGLSRDDVDKIVAYVRELQKANGIN